MKNKGFSIGIIFLVLMVCTTCTKDEALLTPDGELSALKKAKVENATISVAAIDALIQKIEDYVPAELEPGIANSLISKLENAKKSLEKGNEKAAMNQLQAVINQLNGLVGAGAIDIAIGEELIFDVKVITGECTTCGQTFIDSRDNREYKTVLIGDQCWMAENLNVGDMIEGSVEQSDNDVIEKYCYQDSPAFCDTYGALYQWDEMMGFSTVKSSQGICPDGWHIPSDQEVQDMEVALGMDSTTAALTNVWRGSDEGTQMALGGSAGYETLYSGRRVTGGMYSAIENYEYLWTSSEAGNNAWRRCLRVADPRVGRYNTFPKIYGMSVRCIEN
ncbi:MAG: hypothetical protein KAI29_28590 [Cyclobacteriaceae bacterium]|nr:hypothetical protein [Cyclobacteriaceae bacterium]